MSELVPLAGASPFGPPAPADADDLFGPPATRDYRPTLPSSAFWTADGLPRLNVVADIEAMLIHPQVEASLAYFKGAVHGAKFTVEASAPAVQEYVQGELERFWQSELETAQTSYDFGWGGFEPCYREERGLVLLDRLLPVHPRDCRVLRTGAGGYCGVRVRGASGGGPVDLPGPASGTLSKAFWFSHRPRYDRWYGRSQLRGAWRPWRRLAGRDGCEDTIDGGFYRGAYSGPTVYFPPGTVSAQSQAYAGQSNRDAARDMANRYKNGGSTYFPSLFDDKGNRQWELVPPQQGVDVTKWLPYEEWLSKRISVGVGVPPEIQEAADTGSGYSGRLVPLEAFFAARDVDVRAMLRAWVWQLGRPQVAYLFGPGAWFTVTALPLLQSRQQAQAQAPGKGQPGGAERPEEPVGPPAAPKPPAAPAAPRPTAARLALDVGPADAGDPLPEALRGRLAALAEACREELLAAGPEGAAAVLAHYRDLLAGLLAGAMTDAQAAGASDYLPAGPAGALDTARFAYALRGLPEGSRDLLLGALAADQAEAVRAELARPEAPAALPFLDEAAEKVRARRPVGRPAFDALADSARRQAFTVAGDMSDEAIATVRDAAAAQAAGTIDRRAFEQAVEGVPFLSPQHLETVFRQNVMAALSDGLEAALSDPAVGDGFPYRAYDATHDSRVRDDHLLLERAGLNGTNVYRADDPVWQKIRPPWDWNDRCTWRPLSVDQAAELGVKEAQAWRDTGTPPARPEHVPVPALKPTTYQRLAFDPQQPRDERGRWALARSERPETRGLDLLPRPGHPAVQAVPEADVTALVAAHQAADLDASNFVPLADLAGQFDWPRGRFAHTLSAAWARGRLHLLRAEGYGAYPQRERAWHFASPDGGERFGSAARPGERLALDPKGGGDGHWVTIGGQKGADGKRHGGSPVYIQGGRITKGHPGLVGKTIGALKEDEGGRPTAHVSDEEFFKRGWEFGNLQKALGIKKPVMGPKGAELTRAALARHPGGRVIAALLNVDGSQTSYDRNGFAERGMDAFHTTLDNKFPKRELEAASDWLGKTFSNANEELANVNQYRWLRGVVLSTKPGEDAVGLTHRQELKQSREYERAKLAKAARKEGIAPAHLHQLAADILAHDREFTADRTKMLQHARKVSEALGYGSLQTLKARHAGGKIDADAVKGLDDVAERVAAEFPGHLGDDPQGRLYDLLSQGNPEPLSEEEAYAQALDHLREHKPEPAPEGKRSRKKGEAADEG